MNKKYLTAVCLMLSGCVSHTTNLSAPNHYNPNTVKIVDKTFDDTQKNIVSRLSKSFFVINNIEKESGIISISFSSDNPYEYIDCGELKSTIGGKTSQINLSRDQTYPWPYQQSIYTLEGTVFRDVSLSGRVNIYIEQASSSTTEVNANTKYVVETVESFSNNLGQSLNQLRNSVTFQTNTVGLLQNIRCRSTGKLEEIILELSD